MPIVYQYNIVPPPDDIPRLVSAYEFTGLSTAIKALPSSSLRIGHERRLARFIRDRNNVYMKQRPVGPSIFRRDWQNALDTIEQRPPSEELYEFSIHALRNGLSEDALKEIGGHAIGVRCADFRVRRVGVHSHDGQFSLEYTPSALIPEALSAIADVWNKPDHSESASEGLWVLATFLACHPFPNANGRVARALYNAYLYYHARSLHGPIPWALLSILSFGEFETAILNVSRTGDLGILASVMRRMLGRYGEILKGADHEPCCL